MGMTIKYGGRIQASYPVATVYTGRTIFEKGDVLEVYATDGTLRTADRDSKGLIGLAMGRRQSANDDQSVGVEGSKKQTIIVDTSVIETTVWLSGITMAAGDRLYAHTSGKLTNADPGGASRPVGSVISVTLGGIQNVGTMTALWSPMTLIV